MRLGLESVFIITVAELEFNYLVKVLSIISLILSKNKGAA